MAHNFNRDKRRIEEGKKKKQEEKRLKKLQRAQGLSAVNPILEEGAKPPMEAPDPTSV